MKIKKRNIQKKEYWKFLKMATKIRTKKKCIKKNIRKNYND